MFRPDLAADQRGEAPGLREEQSLPRRLPRGEEAWAGVAWEVGRSQGV